MQSRVSDKLLHGGIETIEASNCTAFTLLAELKACTSSSDLVRGRRVHLVATRIGVDGNKYLVNTLIGMYAHCGSMADAQSVFDGMQQADVVSWTVLMLGYADNGQADMAFELMARMPSLPDSRAFVAVLKACGTMAGKEDETKLQYYLSKGMALHCLAAKLGRMLCTFVGNTLVGMYAKFGDMSRARRVFDQMESRTVVSWNALIFGYAENGEADGAVQAFKTMRSTGFLPNARTYVAALKACSLLVALEMGKAVHWDVCKAGLDKDVMVATALVDFYGKCGTMADAQLVFDSLPTKGVIVWTTLMAGYSYHGDAETVFSLLDKMRDEGTRPDSVTLLCVLNACCHAGLVDRGKEYLEAMRRDEYSGLRPGIEHYTCVVDALGRGNQLVEAVEMARSMPFKADVVTWTTILVACCKWRNVEVGKLAFDAVVALGVHDALPYVLMESIYASRGMIEERFKVEALMPDDSSLDKCWWTDEIGVVHRWVGR